jgi:transcriptional regulator with XRE-family HTH domain
MDEDTNNPITLKAFREAAGYSQSKLGERIGVSQSAVKYWEMGKREPTIGNVAALARTFNVSFKIICQSMGVDISGIPDDRIEGESID